MAIVVPFLAIVDTREIFFFQSFCRESTSPMDSSRRFSEILLLFFHRSCWNYSRHISHDFSRNSIRNTSRDFTWDFPWFPPVFHPIIIRSFSRHLSSRKCQEFFWDSTQDFFFHEFSQGFLTVFQLPGIYYIDSSSINFFQNLTKDLTQGQDSSPDFLRYSFQDSSGIS